MALQLEYAGGGDDAKQIMEGALEKATGAFEPGPKDKLASILGSDKCKGVMSGRA